MDFLVSVSPQPHAEEEGGQKHGASVAMAQLSQEFGVNASTVSRYLAKLDITPERRGNFRFLTEEQYGEVSRLKAHLDQGYEFKDFDKNKQSNYADTLPQNNPLGLKLSKCEKRWELSSNAVKSRAKYLGVELARPNGNSSFWPWDDLALGDELHSWMRGGNPMRLFRIPAAKLSRIADNVCADTHDLPSEPVCYVSIWGDPSERLVAHRNDDRIFYLDAGSSSWIELPSLPL